MSEHDRQGNHYWSSFPAQFSPVEFGDSGLDVSIPETFTTAAEAAGTVTMH
jgi:hypothetical protein